MNHTFSSLRTAASIAAGAILLAACSAGTSIPTSSTASSPVPVLAAARNSICVTPATSAQTVTLPATAGVTAAVALGAFDGSASGCDRFTLATGSEADAVALDENARSTTTLQRTAQAVTPRPLLSLTAGETSAGATFGFATIINGVTLTTSPDVQFPDGEYPAYLITTLGGETFPQRLTFIARGGVLTLTGLGQPLILHAGTTLYVYPRGTVPPGNRQPEPVAAKLDRSAGFSRPDRDADAASERDADCRYHALRRAARARRLGDRCIYGRVRRFDVLA